MYCSNCEREAKNGTNFCEYCGAKLKMPSNNMAINNVSLNTKDVYVERKNTMLKSSIIIEFMKKSVLPIVIALILYLIFREFSSDKFIVWILCGIPFGIGKTREWIFLRGGGIGETAAVFVLNFIIAGLIGGFVLIWKLLVAIYYIPYTVYLLIS